MEISLGPVDVSANSTTLVGHDLTDAYEIAITIVYISQFNIEPQIWALLSEDPERRQACRKRPRKRLQRMEKKAVRKHGSNDTNI